MIAESPRLIRQFEIVDDSQGDALGAHDLNLRLDKGRIELGLCKKSVVAAERQAQVGQLKMRRCRVGRGSRQHKDDSEGHCDQTDQCDQALEAEHRPKHPAQAELRGRRHLVIEGSLRRMDVGDIQHYLSRHERLIQGAETLFSRRLGTRLRASALACR